MRALAAFAAAALAPLLGCQGPARLSRALPPLEAEGEVLLYLQPFPAEAERLSFSVESIAAVRADGAEVALELRLADLSAAAARSQRLLAFGRLPPGSYGALAVKVKRAELRTEEGRADLAVSKEPDRIPVHLEVTARRATVLALRIRQGPAVSAGYGFTPAFDASVPHAPLAPLAGYCSMPKAAAVAVFDKRRREVVAVIPAGREPEGMAVDPVAQRAYLALSGDDQIQVLDLGSGEETARIRLQPGDRPADLALAPDGRTAVALNPGSRTASFLDAASLLERDRVPVGEEPVSVLVDRSGRRAYVFNRRSAGATVLDVANRQVVGTLATDPEPLLGQLNRAGTRLYVLHAGSAYLGVYNLPDLSLASRVFVGLGATALKVDPRTDLLYVGLGDERRLAVYDPALFIPVDQVELPGAPGRMVIDDAENALFVALPESREVAVVDLGRRRVVARIELPDEPHAVAVVGERN